MADEQQDWYIVLGVERTATSKEITKAYRVKALKYHPDKNPDPNAAKIFHDLSKAYEVLLDPAARAAFDNLIKVKVQAQERADRYDSVRRKMKEDLENREAAFKKHVQEEKAAELRMKYELERLKKENEEKRSKAEAELLRKEEEMANAVAAAKAQKQAEVNSLDSTLTIKWKKKKHSYESSDIEDIFKRFGSIDSCISRKQGAAIVSFTSTDSAYTAMKAHEDEDRALEPFTLAWAGGSEPEAISQLRAKDRESSNKSGATQRMTPPSPRAASAFSMPKPAFNTNPAYKPVFNTPAFGSGQGFATLSSTIPAFGVPKFDVSHGASFDDYEAATLAKARGRENERKRLAEEMVRQDEEEKEQERHKVQRQRTEEQPKGKDE